MREITREQTKESMFYPLEYRQYSELLIVYGFVEGVGDCW